MLYKVMLSFFLAITLSGNVVCSSEDKYKTIRMDIFSSGKPAICFLGSIENIEDVYGWRDRHIKLYKSEYGVAKIKGSELMHIHTSETAQSVVFTLTDGVHPRWEMRGVVGASQEKLDEIALRFRSIYSPKNDQKTN